LAATLPISAFGERKTRKIRDFLLTKMKLPYIVKATLNTIIILRRDFLDHEFTVG